MNCVSADEVTAIMGTCTLTDDQVDAYISASHIYITNVFENNTTVNATTKAELEKWFTAHLIASTQDRITSEEKVGLPMLENIL